MEECVATSVTFFSSITANHIQSLICLIGGASCLIPLVITPLVDYEKSTLLDALLSQRFKDSALFTMTFTLPVLLDIVFEVVQSLTIKQKQDKAKLSIKDALLNTTERFVLYCGIVTVPSIAFMPVDTQNLANIYLCLKRSRSVLVFGTVVTSLCRYNVKMWTVKRSYLLLLLLVVATFSGAYADNTSMNTAISISHNISVSLYVVTGSLFLYCNGSWICSNAFKWLSGTSRTSDPDLSDEFIGHRQTNTIFPLVFATATSVISIVAMGSARSYTGDKKYSEADLFYQNLFIALYLLMLMYISERMLKYEVVQGLVRLNCFATGRVQ